MIYNFDQVALFINDTGILADSASLSYKNNAIPIQSLNNKSYAAITTNGPEESKVDMTYYLTYDDPSFGIAKMLKASTQIFTESPQILKLGGISGSFYLDSLSFSLSPQQTIKANASYFSYSPISGNLAIENVATPILSDIVKAKRFYLQSGQFDFSNPRNISLLNFDYSWKGDWEPIFNIDADRSPNQLVLHGGEESYDYTTTQYLKTNSSGENMYSYTTGILGLLFYNELFTKTLFIDFRSGIVTDQTIRFEIDNAVTIKNSIINPF